MRRCPVPFPLALAAAAWGCGVVVRIDGGTAASQEADAARDATRDGGLDADGGIDSVTDVVADTAKDGGTLACTTLASREFDAESECQATAAAECPTDAGASGTPCTTGVRSCGCAPSTTTAGFSLDGKQCTCVR